MNPTIKDFNEKMEPNDQKICEYLSQIIDIELVEADSKIWHAHPVWFFSGNPIVGYSKQKNGIRLMFWSGADFQEPNLNIVGGKFKDASIFYNSVTEILPDELKRWLKKSRIIQWDYKNLVKKKGLLEKINL